jgi:hypothetical protein
MCRSAGHGLRGRGVDLVFGCGADHSLTSRVDSSSEPWTVEFDQGGTSAVLTGVDVVIAWY